MKGNLNFSSSSGQNNNIIDENDDDFSYPNYSAPEDDEQLKLKRDQSRVALETMEAGVEPDELYNIFNQFALYHYNTRRSSLISFKFGKEINIDNDSMWTYKSVNSATVAFQTNLPVKTSIIYSEKNSSISNETLLTERYFYTHVHYLKNLKPNTLYEYQIKTESDKGEVNLSTKYQLTTKSQTTEVSIENVSSYPVVLDQPNTTYILKQDLLSPHTAIDVTADNITLDLNGHTVEFANSQGTNINNDSPEEAYMGVRVGYPAKNNFNIFNGIIKEAHGYNNEGYLYGGLNPIFMRGITDAEIAGVTVEYHGAQTYGVWIYYHNGKLDFHHNVMVDKGWNIKNRHGSSGGRALYVKDTSQNHDSENNYKVQYNLVKRTRQNGLAKASTFTHNEVYVDSWSTNAFALQPHSSVGVSAGNVSHNKVFLTGYHAIAVGWAHNDLMFTNNFIHMEGIKTGTRRWYESFGDQDSLNGIRVTNYNPGGQVRDNLQYKDNLIIGYTQNDTQMRGTEIFSDYSITNTFVENNIIEILAEDEKTERITPIVTQGIYSTRDRHLPVVYKNALLSSNVANIRFGDDYGKGNSHHFYNVTLRKVGNNSNYHTIVFDGGYDSSNHKIIDPILEGGASLDDVYWRRTAVWSSFSVGWTTKVKTTPNANIKVYDENNNLIDEVTTNSNGEANVALIEYAVRPTEWFEGRTAGGAVKDLYGIQKIPQGPYKLQVNGANSTTVNAIKNQVVEL